MLSFALVDVNGTNHALDGSLGISVRRGLRGGGFPDIKPTGDKLPYAPGIALRRVSTAETIVEIPLTLRHSSQALLETLIDDLRSWVLPGTERNGSPATVRFQATLAGGAIREIEGVATLDRGDDASGWQSWQLYVLTLYCPDPYARDVTPTVVTLTEDEGQRAWFNYWPYDVTPSGAFAEITVTNDGHVEAWPVWVVTGPFTSIELHNLTTGELLAVDYEAAAGEAVTIDTSERGDTAKTITAAGGANLWPFVDAPTSTLWPFEVGENRVRITLKGSAADTAVALTYRRRWAGLHR